MTVYELKKNLVKLRIWSIFFSFFNVTEFIKIRDCEACTNNNIYLLHDLHSRQEKGPYDLLVVRLWASFVKVGFGLSIPKIK